LDPINLTPRKTFHFPNYNLILFIKFKFKTCEDVGLLQIVVYWTFELSFFSLANIFWDNTNLILLIHNTLSLVSYTTGNHRMRNKV
jgi:hypothetical protein